MARAKGRGTAQGKGQATWQGHWLEHVEGHKSGTLARAMIGPQVWDAVKDVDRAQTS